MWAIDSSVRFHQPLGDGTYWAVRLAGDRRTVTAYAADHSITVEVPRFDPAALDALTTAAVNDRNLLRSATAATPDRPDAGPRRGVAASANRAKTRRTDVACALHSCPRMRLVMILSVSLFATAIAGCDSSEITGTENPSRADLNPPDKPELCLPACEILTATCDATADGAGDVEIIRGCVDECLGGAFPDDQLECLAAADCTTVDDCLD